MGAVEGGVNSVDSSFTFGGRGGQEDTFALRYLLESEGYNISSWDEDKAMALWSQNHEKFYPNIQNYWRPDPIRANIAGGQRSILQAELDGLRQGERIKNVFDINMTTRCWGGGGIAVTPLADIYARNTLLWIQVGTVYSLGLLPYAHSCALLPPFRLLPYASFVCPLAPLSPTSIRLILTPFDVFYRASLPWTVRRRRPYANAPRLAPQRQVCVHKFATPFSLSPLPTSFR
jgi:hypothetical protein